MKAIIIKRAFWTTLWVFGTSFMMLLSIFLPQVAFAQVPKILSQQALHIGAKSLVLGHLSTKYMVLVDASIHRAVESKPENRTPAEQKLESALLEIVNQIAIDSSLAKNAAKSEPAGLSDTERPQHLIVRADDQDRVFVMVSPSVGFTTSDVDTAVIAFGGRYDIANAPEVRVAPFVEAWIPVLFIKAFAARQEVSGIRRVLDPMTNTGSVESLGVSRLRADAAMSVLNITGSGVKVGVMSDDCSSGPNGYLKTSISTGNIDSNFVSLSDPDSLTGSHEGLAMSEIVQDVAPKAQIYFATAEGGHTQFGDNMYALANAGCKVICDDIEYLDEPVFQDGDLAGYVNDLCANHGVVYISSAGNQAFASNYQTYKNMSGTGLMSGKNVFDFTGSDSEYLPVALAGGWSVELELQWDDPWGSSKNDYNLYLINPARTAIVASSTNVQPTYINPLELLDYSVSTGGTYYIAVERKTISSSDPDSLARTKLTGWPNEGIITFGNATSSTFGHSCADSCLGAGAISASSSNYNVIELYSGQGPSYNITFGTGTRTINETRLKPDLACFDAVATSVSGFSTFSGTSASAPHIAGTAALLLSAQPSLTATQARAALRSGTIDEGAAGNDYVFGYGRLDAFKSITQALSGTGKSYALFQTVNSDIPTNGGSGLSATISPTLTANADSVYLSFTIDSNTKYGNLTVKLTSPDGTSRTVLTRPPNGAGTSTGVHPNVVLGDNASTAIESYAPTGAAEVLGFYSPQNTISSSAGFYNRGIAGNWTLNVVDSGTGVAGPLKNWGIYWKVLPNANESLTLAGTPPYIWASDSSLKTVTVGETVNNGAIPVIKLDTVTANETIANGDIVATTGTNTTSIQLRAKNDANAGRVYAAKYELTDIGGYDSTFKLYVPVLNRIGHISAAPITSSGGTSLGLPSVNPLVSGTTTFTYTLSTGENIDLSIYDLHGKWQISVDNGAKTSGVHTATWNGYNASGSLLADGTYIYQLSAGGSFYSGTITLNH